MIILSFPTSPNPDANGMNYTCLLLGGYILLCLAYYYCPVYGGVHWFSGPVRNVGSERGDDSVSGSDEGGSEKDKDEFDVQVAVKEV